MDYVVLATIRKHRAEAELRVAQLEARRQEIPATRGALVAASRVSRQIATAKAQLQSWTDIENLATITLEGQQ